MSKSTSKRHVRIADSKCHMRIADLVIELEGSPDQLNIILPASYDHFMVPPKGDPDVRIEIMEYRESGNLRAGLERVSYAPVQAGNFTEFVTEGDHLWEVLRLGSGYRIATLSEHLPVFMDFIPGLREMRIHTPGVDGEFRPLGYPAGALLLYLLTTMVPSVLIHAAVVADGGDGYLFTGRSGTGKSTMAGLWSAVNATVIHDDRVFLRPKANGWVAYSTPLNPGDASSSVQLSSIFLLHQNSRNSMVPLSGMDAFGGLLEHCIQHQYDPGMIASLVDSLQGLTGSVPVCNLGFLNGPEIVTFVRNI